MRKWNNFNKSRDKSKSTYATGKGTITKSHSQMNTSVHENQRTGKTNAKNQKLFPVEAVGARKG